MESITIKVECGDTIVIANNNTTIGYATFDPTKGALTYLFVNPAFRRRGYGSRLVAAAEKETGLKLKPAAPISRLGRAFLHHWREREDLDYV